MPRDDLTDTVMAMHASYVIARRQDVYLLTCRECKVQGAISTEDRPSVQRLKLMMLEDHAATHRKENPDAK